MLPNWKNRTLLRLKEKLSVRWGVQTKPNPTILLIIEGNFDFK